MRREVKIGILFFAALIIFIAGYKYLQGKELFDDSVSYVIRYDEVDKLEKNSKVYVNGMEVGSVTDLGLDPNDADYVIVHIKVRPEIALPKNTVAVLVNEGVFGGKSIELRFDQICRTNCLQDGDTIRSGKLGPLEAFIGDPRQIDRYMERMRVGLDSLFAVLSERIRDSSYRDELTETLRALHRAALGIDAMFRAGGEGTSAGQLQRTVQHIQAILDAIRRNETHWVETMRNIDTLTAKLAQVDIEHMQRSVDTLLREISASSKGLQHTLVELDSMLRVTQAILGDVQEGKGSMGKFVKDPELYNQLEQTLQRLDSLLLDIREHPRRYLKFSVF